MNNDCKCNKPNTVGVKNLQGYRLLAPKCCKDGVFFNTIVIPKSMGGSSEAEPFAPKNGMYYNALVRYEADDTKFIYDSEGNYTNLSNMSEEEVQEIVNQYIQNSVAFVFDTVADMKLATNLVSGSYAQTLGYYSKNDGGASLYSIVSTEPSGVHYETLNSGLYAILIKQNVMNVRQFGAKGDGATDDADALISCFANANNVIFNQNENYLCSKNIIVNNSGCIDLNGATVTMYNRVSETTGTICIFRITGNFIELKNGELIGDIDERETHSQRVYGISLIGNNVNIHHMKIHKFDADGITGGFNDCTISDCEVYDCGRNNISLLKGENNTIHDIYTHDCRGVNLPGHGICVEPYDDDMPVKNLKIYNIVTKNNYGAGIDVSIYHDGEASIEVYNVDSKDAFYVKLRDDSVGHIDVHDIKISGELAIQDAVSRTMYTTIENVLIKDYIPVVTTSFYGAAVKIRAGISSTGTAIYNLNLKNIFIDGGEPTRGVYIDADSNGSNKSIEGLKCNINTISPITASGTDLTKWKISDIQSDYIPNVSSTLNIPRLSTAVNLTSSPTIDANMPYGCRIKLVNNTGSNLQITSQGNNQYGTTAIVVLAKTEAYITINNDGSILFEADNFGFNILTSTSYSFNIKDMSIIYAKRGTHYNLYYVNYGTLLELAKDSSGTGMTIAVADGVLSVTGGGSAGLIYITR